MLYPARWKGITVDQSKVLKNRLFRFFFSCFFFFFWGGGGGTRYKHTFVWGVLSQDGAMATFSEPSPRSLFSANFSKYLWFRTKQFTRLLEFIKPMRQGRRQGVCLKCIATAARGQKFCASPEKVAQWGTPTHFFFRLQTISTKLFIMG